MSMKKTEILIEQAKLPASIPFEIFKQLTPDAINGTPVVLQRGAVNYKLGKIQNVRIGRDKIIGEIQINFKGHLEFEPILDGNEKVIGIDFIRYVYVL